MLGAQGCQAAGPDARAWPFASSLMIEGCFSPGPDERHQRLLAGDSRVCLPLPALAAPPLLLKSGFWTYAGAEESPSVGRRRGEDYICAETPCTLMGVYCSRCASSCCIPHCPQPGLSLPSTDPCLAPLGPITGLPHVLPAEAQDVAGGGY